MQATKMLVVVLSLAAIIFARAAAAFQVPSILPSELLAKPQHACRRIDVARFKVRGMARCRVATGISNMMDVDGEMRSQNQRYDRWWVLPLAPYENRPTYRYEVVRGQVWSFEQNFGVLYIHGPIRMTIIKAAGGLLAYAPISPTPQCLELVRELEEEHGRLLNIILPSAAVEHKNVAGPFAREFPKAKLWVTPNQNSWPIGLENLGLIQCTQLFWGLNLATLPPSSQGTPWEGEVQHAILGPLESKGPGVYEEAVFLHKATKTLLVTDIVQSLPDFDDAIPEVVTDDARALMFHARDDPFVTVTDTPATRKIGWQRMALIAVFLAGGADLVSLGEAVRGGLESSPEMKALGFGGLYPIRWRHPGGPHPPDKVHFSDTISALKGKVFCPPILQKLILDREPQAVLTFADQIAKWDFGRIVPAHLRRDLQCTPSQFRQAFGFLEEGNDFPCNLEAPPLRGDAQFLEFVSEALITVGSLAKPGQEVEEFRSKRRGAR